MACVCTFVWPSQRGFTAADAARLFDEAYSKSQLSESQAGVDASLLTGSGSVYEDHGVSSQSSLQVPSLRGSSRLGSRGSTKSVTQHQLYSLSAESGQRIPSMFVGRLLNVVSKKAVEDWDVDELRNVLRSSEASADKNVS